MQKNPKKQIYSYWTEIISEDFIKYVYFISQRHALKKRLVELTIVGRLLLKLELVYVYKPKAVLWSKVEILTNSPLISDPFESYM